MKRRSALATLVATGAVVLAGCGAGDGSSGQGAGGVDGNGTDRAFVAAMVPHHESAVDMAEIAQQRAEGAFVRKLAGDIVRTQNEEIATMRREDEALARAGVEEGSLGVPDHAMGMDDDPATLRDAEPFDEAFLKMMIPHHVGAIEMAKAEIAKGQDSELTALARQVIDGQQREIDQMREQLGEDRPQGG